MDASDPYKSTNPWSLARYLKNSCTACPVCRSRCSFDISVDAEEEIIHMSADCGRCGKTVIVPYLGENMDLGYLIGDSDRHYEPDQRCFELSGELCGKEIGGADKETLLAYSKLARIYSETRRPAEAVQLGKCIADEYRSNKGMEGWEDAGDLCLAQAMASATVLIDSGKNKDALEIYNEYLPLTENSESGRSFAFILARAFSVFAEGDAKEPTATVRAAIASLDRMKAENRLPPDDPFVRSRAYEALGVLLSSKNDRQGSMKAMRKALDEAKETALAKITDEGLRWTNRCAREYAFACFHADMKKRSMEALKDAVKLCSANKDRFPGAYAEALLERGMFISDSDSEIPPYLRENMDEAIEILGRPDEDGKYDPLLPVAYYYRSMTGADKENLDPKDLEKAYTIIRDGVKRGDVPESVLTSVMDTYATYLDVNDEEKAKVVRRELAEMGIWVHPPLKKKPKDTV